MSYLKPDTQAPVRPTADQMSQYAAAGADAPADEASANARGAILYLKSYLLMRATIGFLGIALPIALFLTDALWLGARFQARGSLSAYYHSGARDLFVGTLCATAVFLITYKVFEHQLDNVLSIIAGVAILGVALFPTDRPPGSTSPATPLEIHLGEQHVAIVHYICAAISLVSLGVISLFFGIREGKRTQWRGGWSARMSPTFWKRFHWGCAAVIGLALIFMAVSEATRWFSSHSLIIGETASLFAFGLSWLMKGLELHVLLGPSTAEEQPAAAVNAAT